MPETYQWQGALASLGIEAQAWEHARAPDAEAGVVMSEQASAAQLVIRGDAANADFAGSVAEVLGVELPVTPKTAHRGHGRTLLWLGPDEWLLVSMAIEDGELEARLADALDHVHHAVADVSHSRAVIGLRGPNARDLLMKGTNVDLHPRHFGPDNCIQGHLGRCHMLLHQLDESPSYDVYIHRSFAVYAWKWLRDGAREYGVAVSRAGGGSGGQIP
jgi:sarcosine oxidase subunit gamma